MTAWNWNGARWWKFDFHAHTPASEDYGKGTNQATLKNRTPREWLLDYMRAEIDCVAITDHNSGAWIDKLKSALAELNLQKPNGYRPLVLFPGVEISVYGGVHVLAIFGPDRTNSDIDSLLGAVGFRGERGSPGHCTEKTCTEVVRVIDGARGLAIPAHVDDANGLFKQFQGSGTGSTLGQVLDCDQVVAMELVDPDYPKPQSYADRKLAWSEVLGSDSHHPSGGADQRYAGSHYTWIKMGSPDLEGLRLALLDGPLSVQRSDQSCSDPNNHAPLAIDCIEISQARYMGRSSTFRMRMNPWLNTVIGGRGTGKSTLVELLRVALRRKDELPSPFSEDFRKYWTVYRTRDDEGLLTDQSRIVVTYRKNGTCYRVQWSQTEKLEPISVQDNEGQWMSEQGDVAQRFPLRIYSQKQVFEMARVPLALLRIVDEAPEVDRSSWNDRWKEETAKFLSLRSQIRQIEAGLADEPKLRGELEDVKRRLVVFEEAGHADILKEYQRRQRQQRAIEEWENTWAHAGERTRELAVDIVPEALEPSLFDRSATEDEDLLEKAQSSLQRLEEARRELERLATVLDQVLAKWRAERDRSRWREALGGALAQYTSLRTTLAAQHAGDPSAYGELVQRRQAIEAKLRDFELRRKQINSTRDDADASLSRLRNLRSELTARRSAFLEKVLANNVYVRVAVVPYCATETVDAEFRRLIQREGGGFEKDIGQAGGEGLLGELYSGPTDAGQIEHRLDALRTRIRRLVAGEHERGALHDQRFAAHLVKLPPEALDRLDMWFPEDTLRVEYSTTADGTGFRPIQEGSPGQRTAALLAFLLSYGEEPIVLDQPEDDLDNRLIYDLIVAQLRNSKQKRQVIVVTHNANIVVNGDAELVVALTAERGETRQDCAGCLQDKTVRDAICAVMEGGREAFERRYRRIALETRPNARNV